MDTPPDTNSLLDALKIVQVTPMGSLRRSAQAAEAVRRRIVDQESAMAKIDTAEFNSSI